MNQVKFDETLCKGCGLCVSVCPKKILKLSNRYNSKGYSVAECINQEDCIACAFCATMCPETLIEVYKEKKD